MGPMRITSHTDYALRTLIYLAAQRPEKPVPTGEVAKTYGISLNHLLKVINDLRARGYITVARGKGGGIALARNPEDIRVGQVVVDMEPDFRLVECFDPGRSKCCIGSACALRGQIQKALRAFIDVLNKQTLEDIVRKKPRVLRKLLNLGGEATR